MRILVTGQCSLHWGRLEYGNIGNYYVTETLFKEIHRVFPGSEIITTFQMTKEFQKRENVSVAPLDLFYGWNVNDLEYALREYGIAQLYNKTNSLWNSTPYIDELLRSDLVIDFSGDMWGDNADLQGEDRFLIGLLKNRTAQLLRKPTILFEVTPGPFENKNLLPFATETFNSFDKVFLRDVQSQDVLKKYNISLDNCMVSSCQSFLFEGTSEEQILSVIQREQIINENAINVGLILCGFNFQEGPYNKQTWRDDEFLDFAEIVEYMVNEKGFNIILISHSNGFVVPPAPFQLLNGRDFYILEQLYHVLQKRGKTDLSHIKLINRPYLPKDTFAIIRHFDMLVSGRLHGAVAGLAQGVPTVAINYANGPRAHKLLGYMKRLDLEEYLASPFDVDDIKAKIDICWNNHEIYHNKLIQKIPVIRDSLRSQFDMLPQIYSQHERK